VAGKLVPIIPKTTYDFTNIQAGAITAALPIGDPVDTLEYPLVGLIVRVHANNVGGTSYIQVGLYFDGFLDGSSFAYPDKDPWTELQITNGIASPTVLFRYGTIWSQYATVALTSNNSGVGGSIAATISVDLYLRNADP